MEASNDEFESELAAFADQSGLQLPVATAVEDQRRHGRVGVELVDPQDDHGVITDAELLLDAALEPRARALDEDGAARGDAPRQGREPVVSAGRQPAADVFLVGAQDTDAQPRNLPQPGPGPRALRDAHRHEGRIERYRRERASR